MNEATIREAIQNGSRFDSYRDPDQLQRVVRYEMNNALKLRGQGNMDAAAEETTVRKISEVLMRDYPNMTDAELKLVMEGGVSGELGRDTWVSGANIMQWLRQYSTHVSRLAVIDEEHQEERNSKRKTQAEIDELNRKACEGKLASATEYYRKHGTIFGKGKDTDDAFHLPQFAAVVYDWHRERGVIPEPSEQEQIKALRYADMMLTKSVIMSSVTREVIHDEWYKAHLLELYIKGICTH